MLKEIKEANREVLNKSLIVEVIPNDGLIVETMHQAVVTFNEEKAIFYLFKGIFKKQFTGESYEFLFSNIKDIEFGKYAFKHQYVKIAFTEDEYLVFSYYKKLKKHPEHEENLKDFLNLLEKIAEGIPKEEIIDED